MGAWVRLRAVGWVLHLHTGRKMHEARRAAGQVCEQACEFGVVVKIWAGDMLYYAQ